MKKKAEEKVRMFLLRITEMDKVLLQVVEIILHSLSLTCSLEFRLILDV
jgi:hypothetical protein